MSNLTQAIFAASHALPEGGMLSPKEFLHVASRAAIDKAMSRLASEGKLLRVKRGTYAVPVTGRFGSRAPSTESIVKFLERRSGENIVASGAVEANVLGLTTQVPTREVFLTSGASKTVQLGNRTVEIKHGKRWELALKNRPAGKVLRALAWLGPEKIDKALEILYKKLPQSEWREMHQVCSTLPSWLALAICKTNTHG